MFHATVTIETNPELCRVFQRELFSFCRSVGAIKRTTFLETGNCDQTEHILKLNY